MKIRETRRVSKSLEKKTGRMKKADWIRQIQKEEGNFDCLFTANEYCDQWNCYFREECLFRLKT